MQKVALHNLGCKVNSYEMDVIGQKLTEKGYELVPFDTKADVYIINTCTVTNIADRKSRQMLHQAKKRNPEAVVVAVGCYVQTGKEQVLTDARIDLAILRVAAAEILFEEETPDSVAANEAVELAKKYGTEKSPGFINGLLGSLVKENEGA